MVACGVNAEVQPFEMMQACLAVFTDLDQVSYFICHSLFILVTELSQVLEFIASLSKSSLSGQVIEDSRWRPEHLESSSTKKGLQNSQKKQGAEVKMEDTGTKMLNFEHVFFYYCG